MIADTALKNWRMILTGIALAAAALLCAVFALKSCADRREASAKARLATEQQGAAIQSGHDAVETLGNASARETEIHDSVKEGVHEIDQAPAGDSNAAADRAACRLRAYRSTARCVALLGPVAQ